MSWREQLVLRILLLIARIVALENPEIGAELKTLANHIFATVPKAPLPAASLPPRVRS